MVENRTDYYDDLLELSYSEDSGILSINSKSVPPVNIQLINPRMLPPTNESNVSVLLNSNTKEVAIRVVYGHKNSTQHRIEVQKKNTHYVVKCDDIKFVDN